MAKSTKKQQQRALKKQKARAIWLRVFIFLEILIDRLLDCIQLVVDIIEKWNANNRRVSWF